MWQEAFMFYKRREGDLNRPLHVSFDGDNMEIGIDTGGPRREFFQMLVDKMTSISISFFEADMPNLLPTIKGSTTETWPFLHSAYHDRSFDC